MRYNPPFSYEVKCLCSLCRWILRNICSVRILFSSCFCFLSILFSNVLILVWFFISSQGVNNLFLQNQDFLFQYTIDFTTNWLEEAPFMMDIVGDWLVLNSNEGNLGLPGMVDSLNDTEVVYRVGIFVYSMIVASKYENMYLFTTKNADFFVVNPPDVNVVVFAIGYQISNETPDICCPYTDENQTSARLIADYFYDKDFSFNHTNPSRIAHYESRTKPWYVDPASHENSTNYFWNNFLTAHGMITSSISRNIRKNENEVLGVIGNNLLLHRWDLVISTLRVEPGILFFIDQTDDGLLLSSSDPTTEVTRVDEATGVLTRVKVEETNLTVIRDAANFMKSSKFSATNSITDIEEIDSTTFPSHGDKWHIRAQRVEITGNFKILVVYIIKDSDVFSDIKYANHLSLYISYSLVAFFLVSFVIIVYLCFCPLNILSREMKKLEKMETSIYFEIKSYLFFYEIRKLRRRFEACVVELEKMKSFLPDGVINDADNSSDSDVFFDSQIHPFSSLEISSSGEEIIIDGYSTDREEVLTEDDGIPEEIGASTTNSLGTNSGSSNGSYSGPESGETTLYDKDFSFQTQRKRIHRRARVFQRDQLPVELEESEVLAIHISIINWEEILKNKNDKKQVSKRKKKKEKKKKKKMNDMKRFLKTHSDFLNFVMGHMKKARIVSFGLDHITLAYVRGSRLMCGVKCVRGFVKSFERRRREKMFEYLEKQQEQQDFIQFQLIVTMALENTIVGKIGSSRMRRMVQFDGSVERAKFLGERFTDFFIPLIRHHQRRRKTYFQQQEQEEEEEEEEEGEEESEEEEEEEENCHFSIIKNNTSTTFLDLQKKNIHVFSDSNVKDFIIIRELKNSYTFPIDICLRQLGKESESRPIRTGYINSTNCEKVFVFQVDFFVCEDDSNATKQYKLYTGGFDACINEDFKVSWSLFEENRKIFEENENKILKMKNSYENGKYNKNIDISDFLEIYKFRFIRKIIDFVHLKIRTSSNQYHIEDQETTSNFSQGSESIGDSNNIIRSENRQQQIRVSVSRNNSSEDLSSMSSMSSMDSDEDLSGSGGRSLVWFSNLDEYLDQNAWEMEQCGYLLEYFSVLIKKESSETDL